MTPFFPRAALCLLSTYFLTAASATSASSEYLGSWGFDSSADTVWAILDHNSDFAIIPEANTFGLIAVIALAVVAGRKWQGRRRK